MAEPMQMNRLSFRTLVMAALALQITTPGVAAQDLGRQGRDTLLSLASGANETCITTTSEAAYCWGILGITRGTVYRVMDATGHPARLRALVPYGWNLCGTGVDGDVWCNSSITGGWVDSAGRPQSVPEACAYSFCVRRLSPRGEIPAAPVRFVAPGSNHGCALAANGKAYCWGKNSMGQLGTGVWSPDSTASGGEAIRRPVAVAGGPFVQLSVGEMLTCGITPRGAIYCWGYGQSGTTGDTAVMHSCSDPVPFSARACSRAAPTRILPESFPDLRRRPEDVRFVRVAAGMRLACAVSDDGGAYCWGGNYRCALGRCRVPDSPRARQIQVPGRVVEIGAGYHHACARTADQRIFCWGTNVAGQLGSLVTVNAGADGNPPDYRDSASANDAYDDPCFLGGRCSPAAVQVSPGRRWAALSVGSEHNCALAEDDGGVYCWGGSGPELGLGTQLVTCQNRSRTWGDARCQPTPTRVPGLPPLAPPTRGNGPSGREGLNETRRVRVVANRSGVRVIFPRDTVGAWGWPPYADREGLRYTWGFWVQGVRGSRNISLSVGPRDSSASEFPSIEELVASAKPLVCPPGAMVRCNDSGVDAFVDSGRVVLAIRGRTLVEDFFGLRPGHIRVWHQNPFTQDFARLDSARVEYIPPQIPAPSPSRRAEAEAARRRDEAATVGITRTIAGGEPEWGQMWLAVGDSVELRLEETKCHFDVCYGGSGTLSTSGWSVADTSVVRLRVVRRDSVGRRRRRWDADAYIVARQAGRTTIHVRGIHGPSDTALARQPPERELEREIVVTRPIARLEIAPRIGTVQVGEQRAFRVAAIDAEGHLIEYVPADLQVAGGSHPWHSRTYPQSVIFETPGTWVLSASFAGRKDTLTVTAKQ